jgi:ribose 5-phosphate isomerase B
VKTPPLREALPHRTAELGVMREYLISDIMSRFLLTCRSEYPIVEGVSQLVLAVGGDHAGFPLKGPLIEFLRSLGHAVVDCGSYDPAPVDFPDITWAVCESVRSGRAARGILVCGTGVGACIAANKIPGIRASVCHDVYSAHQCVEHDDVNVVCVGAQVIGQKVAEDCLRAFLAAEFSTDEQFRRRVAKLGELERRARERQ